MDLKKVMDSSACALLEARTYSDRHRVMAWLLAALTALGTTAASHATAAESDASPSAPASFVRALHDLVTVGDPGNSVEVGKILGLTFTQAELSANPGTRHLGFKPEILAESIADISRSFDYRVVINEQTSTSYGGLTFRINAGKQCVTRAMVENIFGIGQFRTPPIGLRASRENDRGSGLYGLIYWFERKSKSVRVILDFERDYCLHAVSVNEGPKGEK